jgi:hypothetical protein
MAPLLADPPLAATRMLVKDIGSSIRIARASLPDYCSADEEL